MMRHTVPVGSGAELNSLGCDYMYAGMLKKAIAILKRNVELYPNVGATVGAILGQPLPDLADLRPALPPRLVSLVGRLLVNQRALRLASARQLAAELEAILREMPP